MDHPQPSAADPLPGSGSSPRSTGGPSAALLAVQGAAGRCGNPFQPPCAVGKLLPVAELQASCSETVDLGAFNALPCNGDRRLRHVLLTLWQLHQENAELREEGFALRQELEATRQQARAARQQAAELLAGRDDQHWRAIEQLRELLQHFHLLLALMLDLLPLDAPDTARFSRGLASCWEDATPLTVAKLGSWDSALGQFEPLLTSASQLLDLGLHMLGKSYDNQCRRLMGSEEPPGTSLARRLSRSDVPRPGESPRRGELARTAAVLRLWWWPWTLFFTALTLLWSLWYGLLRWALWLPLAMVAPKFRPH